MLSKIKSLFCNEINKEFERNELQRKIYELINDCKTLPQEEKFLCIGLVAASIFCQQRKNGCEEKEVFFAVMGHVFNAMSESYKEAVKRGDFDPSE
jgi:hypothetical protein